jgi:ankyrin repeat protein
MTIEHKESKHPAKIQAAREAIQAGNKALLLSMLSRELLEEAVDSTGNTLLLFAVQAKNLACVQLLVEMGANFRVTNKDRFDASDIASVSEQPEMATYFTRLFSLDKQLTDRIQQLVKPEVSEKPAAGGLTEYQQLQQGVYAAIGKIASAFSSEVKSLGLMEKVLLHATVSGLQEAISSNQSHAALLNNLQDFFRRRETLLENTWLDYCFLPREHICHASCYEVAELLRKATGKTDIYEVLLPISKCERRPLHAEKWINVLADENENDLPAHPGEFVRWHGEIHLWDQILCQAVVNMTTDGKRSLEEIWQKTDTKYTQSKGKEVKPGPLPEALLSVLRQKGAACRELVDYTRERSSTKSIIWQKFEALHQGLVAGSVSGKGEHKGEEYVAGKTGSEAVAVFFDWWNGLPPSQRQQLGSLHAHFDSGYGGELSGDKSVEQLLQQMRNPTLSAEQDALTCLDIISKHLKVILDKNSTVFEQGTPSKTKAQLEGLRDNASAELGKPLTGCVIYDSPVGVSQLLESKEIAGLNELITLKLATAIDMSNMATVQVMLLNHPDLMVARVNVAGPTVRELLRAKVNSFLMRSIVQDAFLTFKYFLTLFPNLLNAPINTEGDTLLISAASNGRINMARDLLEHKQIAVFAQNLHGETARQCAEKGSHVEIIALLKAVEETAFPSLIDQADVDTIKHAITINKKLINLVSAKGQTALIIAIRQENWTLVEWLLAQGADLFLPDASSGKTNALSELVTLLFSKPECKIQASEEARKRAVVTKVFGELLEIPRSREVLLTLQQLGLLTPANLAALQAQTRYIDDLAQGLASLQTVESLTPVNVTALLAQAQHAASLNQVLVSLQAAGPLTQANVTALLTQAQHAASLNQVLVSLQAAGPLTQANVMALLTQAQHAASLNQVLVSLQAAGPLTQANVMALLTQAQHAASLNQVLVSLQAAGPLTQAEVAALLAPQHAAGLAHGLTSLHQVAGLLTPANVRALLAQAPHAAGLAYGLASLQEENRLTQAEVAALLAPQHAAGLAHGLTSLQQVAGLLTPANVRALLAQAPHAAGLAYGLASLQEENRLTQAEVTALLAPQYAVGLSQGLARLQAATLLTPANVRALLAQAQHAAGLAYGLVNLQAAGLLTQARVTVLLAPQHAAGLAHGLTSLHQVAGLLTPANVTALLAQAQYAIGLGQGLACLQEGNILTQANVTALLAQAQHAAGLAYGLVSLQAAGLLTQARVTALLAPQHAAGLAHGLTSLQQVAGLLTPANVRALLAQAQHAGDLNSCLYSLWLAERLTQENVTALLAQAQHAGDLNSCLYSLWLAERLTQENVTALLAQAQHAAGLGRCLASLWLAERLTQENVTALLAQAQHAAGLGQGLASLRSVGLLTQTNFMALLAQAQHAAGLGQGLASLQEEGLLTQVDVMALLAQAEHAAGLGQGLASLQEEGLLTQVDVMALLAQAQHAAGLGQGLASLQEEGLLTPVNAMILLGQVQHAAGLGQGLASLQAAGILTQANVTALLDQAQHATDLNQCLVILQQGGIFNQINGSMKNQVGKGDPKQMGLQEQRRLLAYRRDMLQQQAKAAHAKTEKELDKGIRWLDAQLQAFEGGSAEASGGVPDTKHSSTTSNASHPSQTYLELSIPGDGDCFYSAVALYVGQDQQQLRNQVADKLETKEYKPFLELASGQTAEAYIEGVRRRRGEWAGQTEIKALMDILQRPIIVVRPGQNAQDRMRNPDKSLGEDQYFGRGIPIPVKYNGHNHYDALVMIEEQSYLFDSSQNQINFTALIDHAEHTAALGQCLANLQVAEILDQPNVTALMAQAQHAAGMARALVCLQMVEEMLTQANFTVLIEQAQHTAGIARTLVCLQMVEEMLTQANFTAIVAQAQHANAIAQGVVSLHEAKMLNSANLTTLLTHPQHAAALACCLVSLQQSRILMTPVNVAALLTQANHSANLSRGFACLQAMNILTQANFNLLLQESSNAVSVAEDLSALQAAGILTQANVDAVFGQIWHSSLTGRRGYRPGLGQGLACLQQARLLNNENCKHLIAQAGYATHLSLALHYLQQARILDQASFTQIVTQAQHASELNYIFSYLQRAGLLNRENFNVLLSKSVHAENIKNQLHQLRAAGRLDQENFTIAIQQAGATPLITPVHHSVVSSSSAIPAGGSSGMQGAKKESKRRDDTEERVPQGVVASSSAFFQVSSQQAEGQLTTPLEREQLSPAVVR